MKTYSYLKITTHHFIWLLIILLIPICYGLVSLTQIASGLILITGFAIIGHFTLTRTNIQKDNFIFVGVAIFLGGFTTSFLSIIFGISPTLLLSIIGIGIIIFLINAYRKRGDILFSNNTNIDYPAIGIVISMILLFLFVCQGRDFLEAKSAIPLQEKGGLPDPFFFTLLVHSLSLNTPLSSFYDVGAPLNYQIFSFLIPAFFTKVTGINAQISLWGIWMPFYKIIGPLLIAHSIHIFLRKTSIPIYLQKFTLPIAVILLFILAPINPKYLMHLDFKNIIWLGTGYILPGGNPPFTMAFLVMGLLLTIYFSSIKNWNNGAKFLFFFLIAILIGVKSALYIPLFIFFGILSLREWLEKNRVPLYTMLASLPFSYIIYKKLIYGDSGGMIKLLISPGFLIEDFAKLMHSESTIIGIAVMIVSLLLWGGIRFLIMAFSVYKSTKAIKDIIIGTTVAFFISLLFPLLLRYTACLPDGTLIGDVSFDLLQFVRASFFIVTVTSTQLMLKLLIEMEKKILLYLTLPFLLLTSISLIAQQTIYKMDREDDLWRNTVRNEVLILNPKLLAMRGTLKYHSQLLGAEGIGPWWVSVKRGNYADYTLSNKNYYRNQILDSLLNMQNSENQIRKMKNEGVNVLIATPETLPTFEKLQEKNLIFRKANISYVFELR